jgi:ribosomal-protein-alanine N-acetyltransferase
MKVFAETERLILREFEFSDDHAMFELDRDPEVHRYLGNKPVTNIEQSRDSIGGVRQQYIHNGIGRWAVIEKKSGEFVGWCGLKLNTQTVNGHTNFYDLGYRLIKRYWGSGYATEAALAVLEYGFLQMQLPVIYAMAATDNEASNQILKKLGFTFIETYDHEDILHNWYKADAL